MPKGAERPPPSRAAAAPWRRRAGALPISRWCAAAARSITWLLLATVAWLGCSSAPAERKDVRIAGSDTMLELNRRLAEEFMRSHPGVAVRVEGGGTGTGVQALIDRRVDLCAASRPFTPDEVRSLYEGFETLGLRYLVARDALSVYLHPSNPVRDLTLDQLRGIFTGRLARWSHVGGLDEPIVPVIRPPSSGTHQFFRDHVLGGSDYAAAATTAIQNVDVVAAVRGRPGAIGYGALVMGADLVHCRIGGVEPSPETVRDGTYPLARYLYFYAAAPPLGRNKEFLDWCMGDAGQRVVAEVGFIPLWVGG